MVLLPILLLATAMAMPPDYTPLTEAEGCLLSLGPSRIDAPRRVRAECAWPEASLDAARAVLSDYPAYSRFIPNIRDATIVRVEPDRTLVHQVHDIPVVADREVQLWMHLAERDQGGFVVTWTLADEPFTPTQGHMPVKFNEGMWEVWPSAEGGIRLVHEVAYDPGVRVPDWLIRRYRTTGLATVMRQLRTLVGGGDPAP